MDQYNSQICNKNTDNNEHEQAYIVLKAVVAGVFNPNYFSCSTRNRCESAPEMHYQELCGRNPCVYFTDFTVKNAPQIYLHSTGYKKYIHIELYCR